MSATALELRKALATDSTSTGFTAKIPKATAPTGTGVFDLLDSDLGLGMGVNVPSYIKAIPYGTNGDNDTFDVRLWGWNKVNESDLWVPQLLADLSVVLGNISGAAIAANTFMADTITVNEGASDGGFQSVVSTADDTTAHILIHTRGCRWIEWDFDLAGAQEGAAMNVLWNSVD